MRKFLTAALAALTLVVAPLATADDAFAGRKAKNTAYILGGVLGVRSHHHLFSWRLIVGHSLSPYPSIIRPSTRAV